jgi:uncharacterized protein Usg
VIVDVLNCIAPYNDWYNIGLCLNLPASKLDEIKNIYLYNQKAHFVELWYRLQGQSGFSWIRLQEALMQVYVWQGRQAVPVTEDITQLPPALSEGLQGGLGNSTQSHSRLPASSEESQIEQTSNNYISSQSLHPLNLYLL